MALLAEHGQRQEVLDPGALARLDPVFAPVQGKIAGAIRDLGDSQRRLAALRREPRPPVPGVARRHGEARRARHRRCGRRATGSTACSRARARWPPTTTCSRWAWAAPSSRARRASRCPSTRPRATRRPSRCAPAASRPTMPGIDEEWLVGVVAPRRPAAADLHRGVHRLRLELDAAQLRQYPPPRARSVPRRRRLRAGAVPRLPAPHDAARSADPRAWRATAISFSTAATAISAGPWPAAPRASSPTS